MWCRPIRLDLAQRQNPDIRIKAADHSRRAIVGAGMARAGNHRHGAAGLAQGAQRRPRQRRIAHTLDLDHRRHHLGRHRLTMGLHLLGLEPGLQIGGQGLIKAIKRGLLAEITLRPLFEGPARILAPDPRRIKPGLGRG